MAPTEANRNRHSVDRSSIDQSQLVGTILPGQTIGGLQVLTRSPREFTMIAGVDLGAKQMSIMAIAARDFDAILDHDPTLAKHLVGILSERLQAMVVQTSDPSLN